MVKIKIMLYYNYIGNELENVLLQKLTQFNIRVILKILLNGKRYQTVFNKIFTLIRYTHFIY